MLQAVQSCEDELSEFLLCSIFLSMQFVLIEKLYEFQQNYFYYWLFKRKLG